MKTFLLENKDLIVRCYDAINSPAFRHGGGTIKNKGMYNAVIYILLGVGIICLWYKYKTFFYGRSRDNQNPTVSLHAKPTKKKVHFIDDEIPKLIHQAEAVEENNTNNNNETKPLLHIKDNNEEEDDDAFEY